MEPSASKSDQVRRSSCGGLLDRVPGGRVGILLAVCVVLALGFDLVFFTGFYGSDGNSYLDAAMMLANGEKPDAREHWTIRLPLILPMAAIIASGGPLTAVNLVFIAYHLVLIVLICLFGRILHNRTTGVVAAALVAVCPPCVLYASMPLPDIPMACFIVAAMMLVAAGTKALRTDRLKRAMVLVSLGGIVLMLGCTVKISAAVIAPVFVGYLAASGGRRLKPAVYLPLCFMGGFLLGFAIDTGILHLTYRNVYTGRFDRVIWRHRPSTPPPIETSTPPAETSAPPAETSAPPAETSAPPPTKAPTPSLHESSTPGTVKKPWKIAPADRWRTVARNLRWILGPWYAVLLAGSVLAYPFLRRRSWLLFAVLVWGTVYRTYGSVSAVKYSPHTLQARYFIIYIVIACVMAGFLVANAWHAVQGIRRHQRLAVAAAVALLALGGSGTLVASIRRNDVSLGTRYLYATLQGVRDALDLAKTSFPCWSVVVESRLHHMAWPVYRDRGTSSWIVTSTDEVFTDRLERPFEFLYLCVVDKNTRIPRRDEMLECGLGVKNALYSREGFVIEQQEVGRFSAAKSRLDAIRFKLLGGLLPPPEPFHLQVVYLWKVMIRPPAPAEPGRSESAPPTVRNGGFEQWEKGRPVGWGLPTNTGDDMSKEENPLDGGTAIALGPIRSGRPGISMYQGIVLDRSLAGQHLVVSADVRSSGEYSTTMSVEIVRARSVQCAETVIHPGGGTWRKMRASVGVPLGGPNVVARIRFSRVRSEGFTLLDNVEMSVEPIAGQVELATDFP